VSLVRRALPLVAAAWLAAGCAASGPASPVATTTVDLPASYRFAPAAITVPAGATVTWTNSDHFTHTVQFKDGGLPADPTQLQPGETTSFRFATPGLYHYQCSLHPQNMQGTVEVTPQGG